MAQDKGRKPEMRCKCGEIGFVREIVNNPTDNETPCRKHYLEIVELRNRLCEKKN